MCRLDLQLMYLVLTPGLAPQRMSLLAFFGPWILRLWLHVG